MTTAVTQAKGKTKQKPKKKAKDFSNLPPIPKKSQGLIKKWFKRILWTFIGFFIGFHIMVVALLVIWNTQPINNSMFMILHRLQTWQGVSQTWVESDAISTNVKKAVIAIEDAKFTQHNGFDFQGIETAMQKNEKSGRLRAGGSTITQQLAKNLFLFPERSYLRKAEEAIITVLIESMWDKQRILTAYLNVVEFGNGIYGIESASQYYYKKSAKNLTRQQSASLIAMLPNPKYYQKNRQSQHLRNKTNVILQRMDSAVLPKSSTKS